MAIGDHISIAIGYERLFRSQIIADTVAAEASVDRLIAWHFCPDRTKHGLFFLLLFHEGEIFLSKKLQIAKKLLKVYHPDLAPKTRFWINGLDQLRKLRNKLAHGRVELPADPPPADQAEGVSMWRLKRTGESELEFISRSTVDRHVRHARHLILAGVCIARIVEDRTLQQVVPDREAALLSLIAAAEKGIGDDP